VLGTGERRTTLILLALVLAIDSADHSALGALAPSIKATFHVSNAQIGLLASAFSVVGGLATLPVGVLTDRTRRMTLLAVSIFVWSAAMVFSGVAVSFTMLFLSRLGLGIVTATGGPTVASLVGDLSPASERGRVLSWLHTGEMLGAGAGFLIAGVVAFVLSWRGVFLLLAVIGLLLARRMMRTPEPARHRPSDRDAEDVEATPGPRDPSPQHAASRAHLARLLRESGTEPDPRLVVRGDASRRSLRWAARYVLRVRTDVIVIIAASIGDLFFSGLQLFAVVFVVHRFGLSQATAPLLIPVVGIGALGGLQAGGAIGDRLLAHGIISARVIVGACSYIASALVLVPGLLLHSLLAAAPFYIVGAVCLAAPIPVLDAVRLDVVNPALWGRAEGIRTLARIGAEALAPVTFGVLADSLAGGGNAGLQLAFLIMLVPLLANGLILLLATRTYPRDVASAIA